ncbi:hypothetical protein HDU76_013066, partial [Blyttiomyces sp. JEL0837]
MASPLPPTASLPISSTTSNPNLLKSSSQSIQILTGNQPQQQQSKPPVPVSTGSTTGGKNTTHTKHGNSDGSLTTGDIARLLKELVTTVELAGVHLADGGKLLKHVQEIQDGFHVRREDIKSHLRNRSATNTEDMIQYWLTELYRTAYKLNESLMSTSAQSIGLNRKISITPMSTKRKRVYEMYEEVQISWQTLLLHLTMSIARASSGTAKTVTENLHKLAIATGAPDWEDLTVDDGKSLFLRGEKYLTGLGVPKSYDIAFKSYLAAAKCGNADAMNMLGVMCETGMGREKDLGAAFKWFKQAATLQNPHAMTNLARIHETGKGAPIDTTQASAWYLRASELNDPEAMTSLGHLLENGIGREANPVLAVEWYCMAAGMGYARAQNALGSCYYRGVGVERDYGEAVMWYKKAADQGNPHAQNNLGICYEEGLGVARDLAMAKALYKAASDSKHPSGTNNLGYMLLMEQNWMEAIKLFYLAWALGSADAAYNIGTLYETGCADTEGTIVEENIEMAIRWYREAAEK